MNQVGNKVYLNIYESKRTIVGPNPLQLLIEQGERLVKIEDSGKDLGSS
jgi:hypothetical protein